MFKAGFVGCAGLALMAFFAARVSAGVLGADSPSALMPDSRQSLDGFEPGLGIASREAIARVPVFHPSQILVRMQPFTDRAAQDATLRDAGAGATLRTIALVPGLRVVAVESGRVEEVCAKLRQQPGVMYASPDYVRRAFAQSVPYGISLVKADVAWSQYGRGGGAKVAVLDTGIDLAHPDLPTPILAETFVPGLPVDDYAEHGTHCSGTVLGLDNTVGVVGVAPQASLIIGKVLNNGGYGLDSWIATGIDWAVSQGADVISMSLGGDEIEPALQDACLNAFNAGVLVVAAAGNDSSPLPHYPAAFPGVMSIAAVDSNEQLASFSNFGPLISVSAPGVNVQSTVPIVSDTVTFSSVAHNAANFTGSPGGSVTGTVVNCGTGLDSSEFPAAVAGKIAHIRRGPSGNPAATFLNKATNAVNAGAIGVIISNNTGGTSVVSGTLNDTFFIPVFGMSQNDGNALQALSLPTATLAEATTGHDYAFFNGTSMACPHTAGAGGLLIGLFKSVAQPAPLPPGSVRWILEQTAKDLGTAGRDDTFGWGLINVQAGAGYLYGRAICRGDFNTDGLVDDTDFVQFVAFYNDLISPGGAWTGGDLNGDGFADDADFVEFANSYNNLLCS